MVCSPYVELKFRDNSPKTHMCHFCVVVEWVIKLPYYQKQYEDITLMSSVVAVHGLRRRIKYIFLCFGASTDFRLLYTPCQELIFV